MATVFVSKRRYRVTVHTNDHPPPHVHALGKGLDARFVLNCPEGPIELWDFLGPWKWQELNELGAEIAERLDACCTKWSEIHG